ncbi:MAG TPA: hypothetical protein VGW12_04885 [Pyrinomonadaceae bacterium]|nr:hypothetical protein [Pyrinomonadaceae bacterium]
MHDCRQTQDSLIDLLFDAHGDGGASRARLVAEVERCAACAAEYRSLVATLDACDEASDALAPGENYLTQYHAALTRRLLDAAGDTRTPSSAARATHEQSTRTTTTPFWKRLLNASIRVPVPVAAVCALLFVGACAVALVLAARPASEPVVLAAPHMTEPQTAPQIKFVEVPVVQEKTVTQIVYVPRRPANDGEEARRQNVRENVAGVGRPKNATTAAVTNMAAAPMPSRPNLSGFKPAGEVNLRIIKGSEAREQ